MNKLEQTYEIIINNEVYKVIITKKKIKRLIIKITPKLEIIVSSPSKLTNTEVLSKVYDNSTWLTKRIEKIKSIYKEYGVEDYYNGKIIYLLGKKFPFIQNENLKNSLLFMDDIYYYNGSYKKSRELIYDKHLTVVTQLFNELVLPFKSKIKTNPTLRYSSMRTMWGNCNYNSNTITLNKKLVCLSFDKIKYIIIHELTHLLFPNHSKKFYDYIEKIIPNYKQIEAELKKFAFILHS